MTLEIQKKNLKSTLLNMGPELLLLSATFLITNSTNKESLDAVVTYYKVDKLVEEQAGRLLKLEDRLLLSDIAVISSVFIERRFIVRFTF